MRQRSREGGELAQGVAQHPTVDGWHEAVALGQRQEGGRRLKRAVHPPAQQHLEGHFAGAMQIDNGLRIKLKAADVAFMVLRVVPRLGAERGFHQADEAALLAPLFDERLALVVGEVNAVVKAVARHLGGQRQQGHLIGGAQLGPQRHGANGHMQPDGLVVELEAATVKRLP